MATRPLQLEQAMSLVQTVDAIEYPESDGKPMGETDLHIDWIIRIRDILRRRYREQRVYVASDLLLYYEEGVPTKFVVPDGFVVLDCAPGRRRTFKIWEEDRTPDVVFEVTSRGSRREDEVSKPQVYARLGVREYFLYDPSAEYLDPPLQGFRMAEGRYQRIAVDPETGELTCDRLGITLRLEGDDLQMHDRQTGQQLPTEAEAEQAARLQEQAARRQEQAARRQEQAARRQEQAARRQEQAAREAAEARAAAAESRSAELACELERLQEELKRRAKEE